MLRVDNIWAKGRHHALFGRTTFSVGGGEVIIVQADSQMERTSLTMSLRCSPIICRFLVVPVQAVG